MIKMKINKFIVCRSVGVVPNINDKPVLFHDIDKIEKEYIKIYREFVLMNSREKHKHYGIYRTHHGYHLVMETVSWDETKYLLRELRKLTNSDYMSTLDFQYEEMVQKVPSTMRLRIDRKYLLNGIMCCTAPHLILSCPCYTDLRKGTKEVYNTFD